MKIVIIGGAGMIGQAIAKRHLVEGDQVDIYDVFSNPYDDYSHLHGNVLKDYPDLSQYDLISNQAALVGVGESMYRPHQYMANNIEATTKIINELVTMKVRVPIIHAGSMGPYGEGSLFCPSCTHDLYRSSPRTTVGKMMCPICKGNLKTMDAIEFQELHPLSFYALSKKVQEEALQLFAEAYHNPVISLRYFSVYATDQNPNNPKTGVLTVIANQILNRDVVELNEDGNQTRDLIHVEDVARAHFLASRKIQGRMINSFDTFNIATGNSVSMKHVASRMIRFAGTNHEIVANMRIRIGDVYDSHADVGRAKTILGFTAEHDLEQDMKDYIRFCFDNREKFNSDSWEKENQRLKEQGLQ